MWLLRRVGGLCCTADLYRDEADVWYSSRIQLEIDYEPGEKLGEGSYAVVRAVRRRRDGARLAAKRISKRLTLSDDNVLWAAPAEQKIRREIEILRLLGGQGRCLALVGVLETSDALLMLTPLCAGGDLMRHLARAKLFTEADASRFFRDFCGAVAHCHRRRVAHRDVKPENLLVTYERRRPAVVLADFGSAARFAADGTERFRRECGSPFWSSPEVWARDYDHRGDVYSCGVVLLVLTRGMLSGDEVRTLHGGGLAALLRLQRTFTRRAEPSADLRDLLEALLAPEAARASAADALRSPWLTAARGDRHLANPAAAALRLRATERAARVALSTLLDRAAAAAAEALVEPTPGLPPDCALLGDVIRSLARLGAAGARARGVLADLERDPDLVLVHAPFVLARLSAPPPREEPAAPLSPEKRCHSSDALSSLSGSSRSAPGRRGAPGAGVHGLSMDGTFSGHAGIFLEDLDGSPSARPVEVA